MCDCHPIAVEWLSVVIDKFLFNNFLENYIFITTIHANIKATSDIILIYIFHFVQLTLLASIK